MLNLQRKLKEQHYSQSSSTPPRQSDAIGRISIRDKLLVQEIQELGSNTPSSCRVSFPSASELHSFDLTVRPTEGRYVGGEFKFHIEVPTEYNNVPPTVKCLTRVWHPNISEDGSVCLSLLRQSSIDGLGWSPIRRLKDVVWGLSSLFTDLLDFDDPLNIEAADHYRKDPDDFQRKVQSYIRKYCSSSPSS